MFQIVICSAGRVEILKRQTMAILQYTEMPITIIVPYEEAAVYEAAFPGRNIIGVQKGLVKQRAFARSLFPPEAHILFMDDDISRIKVLEYTVMLVPIWEAFDDVVESLFEEMEKKGCTMWGVYPMCNRGWMKATDVRDTAYIVGAFYGILNSIPNEAGDDEAEDFRRQLRLLRSGGHCIRFNWVGVQTKYWKGDVGGIQRTPATSLKVFQELAEEYSQYVKMSQTRKGRPNLRFHRHITGQSE